MTRVCKTHGGLGLPAGVSRRVAAGCQRRATAVERSNAQRARWLQKLGGDGQSVSLGADGHSRSVCAVSFVHSVVRVSWQASARTQARAARSLGCALGRAGRARAAADKHACAATSNFT